MTKIRINITRKKIEKVLELFNDPQTRKNRKQPGKKKRHNKSFNRKKRGKNLANSTLKNKQRGGSLTLEKLAKKQDEKWAKEQEEKEATEAKINIIINDIKNDKYLKTNLGKHDDTNTIKNMNDDVFENLV